jgi:hypothetical protein
MSDGKTVTANTIGNPVNGLDDDPWPAGHPVEGERVAIFVFEVTGVDEEAENMRTYHVAPAGLAKEGPIGPESGAAQGIRAHWAGAGTGTVVRVASDQRCAVALDDPQLA